MNVTFLIGNGFDINIGLNTRFRDFLKIYLKSKNSDPRIVKFKKDINLDLDAWSDFETQMGKYTEKFSIDTMDDFIYCLDDFRSELIEHLKKQEKQIDFDYLSNNIVKIFRESIINFKSVFPEESKSRIRSLYNAFQYGVYNYNFILFNYTYVLDKCINILKGITPPLSNHRYLSNVYADTIGTVLHIHGTTTRDVIIGVDNANQIINEELAKNKRFIRTIIKTQINKKLKKRKDEIGSDLIKNSNIICVFGMSLGETDKTWWQRIGNWLKSDESHELVIFNVSKKTNPIHPNQYFDIEDKIIERFFELSDFPNDKKDSFEKQIHIGLNTNIFKIDLTQKPAEQKLLNEVSEKELVAV